MLFNCFSCGKMISTKKDLCPYCKIHITHLQQELLQERSHGGLKEKYKGTILSLVTR